jgi:pimeloyl-ACP methyl ester carboxylesterase
LLAQGVATISSGFAVQGWNRNSAVATNYELLNIFKGLYPQTNKVMLWGDSLGANISQAFAETYPNEVDSVGLFDLGYNLAPLVKVATDALWGFEQFFGDGGDLLGNPAFGKTLRISGYSNQPLPASNLAESSIAWVLTTLNAISSNAAIGNLMAWPSVGPVGALLSNTVPPSAAIHVLGAANGLPNRSPHYGGSSAEPLLYANASIENFALSSALAINVIADLELQLGGPIASNLGTMYSSRINSFDSNQFNYIVPLGSSPSALMTGVLGALDTYGTKVAGVCNVKLPTLGVNHGRINKPTVLMCADSDPVTTMANNRQLVIDYNSNVNIGLATSNMLTVLISPAPTTAYSCNVNLPAVLGTSHANYTSNNYLLGGALMLHGATRGSILTGAKLEAGITTNDNLFNGSNVINTSAYALFY